MRHKRVVVTHYGGPEVITIIEEDIPIPTAGELRVKVLAAGVSLPDVLAREGVHPETPPVPYTPGWDLVGSVDQLGPSVMDLQLGETVAAMPIHGCYAQYVCVRQGEVVPVPKGLDAAEAVAVVLNYSTAYQMLHRSAKAQRGQRMLIHGASGGVGSAMLQLAKLAGVEMYGTCSEQAASVVRDLGGIPIDYKQSDFVKEIHRLTGEGVDAVFDGIGGDNLWRSRDALREGGRVVTFGFQSKMWAGRMASHSEGRHPFRESASWAGSSFAIGSSPAERAWCPIASSGCCASNRRGSAKICLRCWSCSSKAGSSPSSRNGYRSKRRAARTRCWARAECSERSCFCPMASECLTACPDAIACATPTSSSPIQPQPSGSGRRCAGHNAIRGSETFAN